jgi:ribosomal protein L24
MTMRAGDLVRIFSGPLAGSTGRVVSLEPLHGTAHVAVVIVEGGRERHGFAVTAIHNLRPVIPDEQ